MVTVKPCMAVCDTKIVYFGAEEYSFKLCLKEHSAHQPLLQLLASTDPDVQRNSIRALSLLTQQYQVRKALADEKG